MMKKIFIFLLMIGILSSFTLALRYEDNYVRNGTIDAGGNLIATTAPVNNSSVIGFICADAGCNSVSGNLWGGSVLNIPGNYIQLTFPTTLSSSFGYGYYFYKDGYIPYEVAANYFGTCPSCDPKLAYDYLTKKQVCVPNINNLNVSDSGGTIKVNVSVHAPIENAGPLNYVPPAISNQYKVNVSVNLEARKNNTLVFSQNKSMLIDFSGNAAVDFNFTAGVGKYDVKVYTTTNDARCISFDSDIENKTITILCGSDSDCGANICLTGNATCSGLDILHQQRVFTCNNPGTSLSFCTNSTLPLLIGHCDFGCSLGACLGN